MENQNNNLQELECGKTRDCQPPSVERGDERSCVLDQADEYLG